MTTLRIWRNYHIYSGSEPSESSIAKRDEQATKTRTQKYAKYVSLFKKICLHDQNQTREVIFSIYIQN